MDSDDLKSKQDILQVIDKLYDKDTREEALTALSENKYNAQLRSECLSKSFGVVTILQQEVLRAYAYLNSGSMDDKDQKRICNTLTIIRSLVVDPSIASQFLDSFIVYMMLPLIENTHKSFDSIRKLCLTVVLEISMTNYDNSFRQILIEQSIFTRCLSCFKTVERLGQTLILMIINNVLYDIHALNIISHNTALQKQSLSYLVAEVMIDCDCREDDEETRALYKSWVEIMDILRTNLVQLHDLIQNARQSRSDF